MRALLNFVSLLLFFVGGWVFMSGGADRQHGIFICLCATFMKIDYKWKDEGK